MWTTLGPEEVELDVPLPIYPAKVINVGFDGKIMAFPQGGELVRESADENPFN